MSGFDFNVVSEVERMTTIMIHLLFLLCGVRFWSHITKDWNKQNSKWNIY